MKSLRTLLLAFGVASLAAVLVGCDGGGPEAVTDSGPTAGAPAAGAPVAGDNAGPAKRGGKGKGQSSPGPRSIPDM